MPTPELRPETIALIERMVGPTSQDRFAGGPTDLTEIDALALGDLWAVAHATRRWENNRLSETVAAETARAVLDLGRRMEPAFRGSACRDYLDLLAREAAAQKADAAGSHAFSPWGDARFCLLRCIELSSGEIGPAAQRFLAATDWRKMPHLALALARLVNAEFQARALEKLAVDLAGSPLLVAELRIVAELDLPAHIALVTLAYPADSAEIEASGRDRYPLSDWPGYVAFAETALNQAAARVRAVHDFAVPYAADKAFTLEESPVIARVARVGLDRDETWVPPVLDELFRKASVAPNSAKTLPSQSVAIALGHAVEAFPTPEAVTTLREVVREVRHAGIKKKLQRNLRGAEFGLADRPEIALRLPLDQPMQKSQLTTLTRCLEAGLALGTVLDYDDWLVRLAGHAHAGGLAGSLVWRILDPGGDRTSVLPVADRGRVALHDVGGATVAAGPGRRVTLWHPADSTAAERGAWRDRLAVLQMKQPFKQVFREHYVVPDAELSGSESAVFSGHFVSLIPFVGLARRERWRLDYDGLTRRFGRWTVRLDLADPIYPGCPGGTSTGNLAVSTSAGGKSVPARLGDLPAATLSEILRGVDLLVSTSGFGMAADREDRYRDAHLRHLAESPLGPMAEMRRQALERVLAGRDGLAGMRFDARHLRLGPYAIHLATGRVTRDGEPVEIDLPKRSASAVIPWLPYDEKLLEAILYTVLEIARRVES